MICEVGLVSEGLAWQLNTSKTPGLIPRVPRTPTPTATHQVFILFTRGLKQNYEVTHEIQYLIVASALSPSGCVWV